ncbi:MAG: amino acid ABC transporter permease [Arenicellales bacterium]|jgi:polar amino acid transport system permease protein/cystine transport system permease protein|nr:amino acid ABC transporter permease [Arenicellales bacterium]MDP6769032.1 amino acid ABC transporter permease [Arenicellales bacterium]|tara:strand:+ start:3318 stop:3974 length:657 start_codon:yes stop_codon:yes gene_type:complete
MQGFFQQLLELGGPLLLGAGTTIGITLASLVVAIVLGLALALIRIMGVGPLNWIINTYVEVFRNTPVLAQIFIIYFSLPYLGINIDPFPAAVIGLGLNGGAILSEVFRAGLNAIHHGQREAALAIGMTPWMNLRHIILPQTWRITLPPLGNYAIALLKDTAVVSAIAAPEIMFWARNLVTSTFETTFVYILAALLYFCLSFPLARLVEHFERKQRAWQ